MIRMTHGLRAASPLTALIALCLLAAQVRAGGGPENAFVIIDPSSAVSMYVGHYYMKARAIPPSHALYINPSPDTYLELTQVQVPALLGTIENLGAGSHIDYVIIPPGSSFKVTSTGLVSDGCSQISRFSISIAYALSFMSNHVLGGTTYSLGNQYFGMDPIAVAFDSNTSWLAGQPSTLPLSRRYFIGAMLGVTGSTGNTVDEILAMIDRSVAVDGTRPEGTFYYMKTTDTLRSQPRDFAFLETAMTINANGGQAEMLEAVLPDGRHDVLGIMTGKDWVPIDTADITIRPGAFCDHMTSYAAVFDNSSQTKVSRWIANGASGSAGTVQEPCNYPGKFPHARMHVYYQQGLSLGEAVFRSVGFVPFQLLTYGDPLTRPFAYLPTVVVNTLPAGPVSGLLSLVPVVSGLAPGAQVSEYSLFIDGRLVATSAVPLLQADTRGWPDGPHEVRVVVKDNTLVASTGRWIGSASTSNHGHSASLAVSPVSGDMSTSFAIDLAAGGEQPERITLLSNGRAVASGSAAGFGIALLGRDLGPGPVRLQALAEFSGGREAISAPVDVDINYGGTLPVGPAKLRPQAFGFVKKVPANQPLMVELPATDEVGSSLSYTVTAPPVQATLEGSGRTRLLRPQANARGVDRITFTASNSMGASAPATILIHYAKPSPGDVDFDGDVDQVDFGRLQSCLSGSGVAQADPSCAGALLDGDTDVDSLDRAILLGCLRGANMPADPTCAP